MDHDGDTWFGVWLAGGRQELSSSMNQMGASPGLLVNVTGVGHRAIWADDLATVGDLATALDGDRLSTVAVKRTGKSLPPSARLNAVDLRRGDTIDLQNEFDAGKAEVNIESVTLNFLTGPRTGEEILLARGENRIGRAADNEVVLIDPGASRHHAAILVESSGITVVDAGSTNGILVNSAKADGPLPLRSGDRLLVGRTWFQVVYLTTLVTDETPAEGSERRSVLVTPGSRPYKAYSGGIIHFPAAPSRGRILRRASGSGYQASISLFGRSLQAAGSALIKEIDTEWSARLGEAPAVSEVAEAVVHDQSRLWPRGPFDPLVARIGLASLPSRIKCVIPPGGDEEHRLRTESVVARHRTIDEVPVLVEVGGAHSVLVAGDERNSRQLAYGILSQLAAQHSPRRMRIWGLLSPGKFDEWDWLKWLPHCSAIETDGGFGQVAADPADYGNTVQRLVSEVNHAGDGSAVHEILLIDGQAVIANELQSVIESIATKPDVRVTVLVVGACDIRHQVELPFGTDGAVILVGEEFASMETVGAQQLEALIGIKCEMFGLDEAQDLAMSMAPAEVADTGSVEHDPDMNDLLAERYRLNDLIPGGDADVVVRQWADHSTPGRLVATLGRNKTGPVRIDLRELGPHGLVLGDLNGMLPAWVGALAANYSPRDLNFYLIDSTNGSIFRSCKDLPHTIGGLAGPPALEVKSALAMLSAEMDRRQAALTSLGCDSVEILERQGQPSPFPYLVVVVDRADKLGGQSERSTSDVVSLDAPAELVTLVDRGQELGVHLLMGAATDDRLTEWIPLKVSASRSTASTVTVGQAPPISFAATLASPLAEIVLGRFRVDGVDELKRMALPAVGDDELERLTDLIREAHQFSGDPSPSMLS